MHAFKRERSPGPEELGNMLYKEGCRIRSSPDGKLAWSYHIVRHEEGIRLLEGHKEGGHRL